MTMEEKAESSLKRKALQKPLADDEDGVVRKRANIERTFLTDDILIHVLQFVKKNPTNGLKNILQLQAANKRMRNMVELLYFSKLTVRQHEKDGLRMNGVALKVDDLQTRLNFFLDCFIRVSILEIRFMPDDVAEGNWWTKLGDCLRDSGKMELKSLTVRTTWNDDQFFGTSDLRFWITNMIESNKPTLRRLDVPASLIPLDSDWHLSYLRLRFLYHPPSQYIYRNEAYHFLPKQSLPIANFISRLKEVKRLCVDGCLGFSAAGDPLEVVCDSLKIVPFYLSASVLKVRRLEVMWPDPSMLFAAPAIVYHFLTLEHFLRQVQTQTPRGAPPTYLSSVRVLGGRFTLSKTLLEITSDHVRSRFFAIAMKSVMPKLRRVDWTLAPHFSCPCKASFENLVRCANHLFVMLADFSGRVTLICDRDEVMVAKDLLLYLMLNGPGFAGAMLDVYAERYVVFLSRNRQLSVQISLQ